MSGSWLTSSPRRGTSTVFAVALATLVALVALVATGCSGDDGGTAATTTTSEIPVETTTTTEVPIEGGEQIFVYEPEVGDCFDLRRLESEGSTGPVDIVLLIDCTLPHRYEVFDVQSFENVYGVYPGEQALEDFANQNCTRNFDGYVGQRYELSEIEVHFWTTVEREWGSGPQPFACTLYVPGSDRSAGSLAGSSR